MDKGRYSQAVEEGLHPVLARILAARPAPLAKSTKEMISPKLAQLSPPQQMADMEKAVTRILSAIQNQEVIGIETDHDCDGQTSHAVIYTALVDYFNYPKNKIRSYIGHRLQEGYGLSNLLVERILQDSPRPSLIITADNGSCDEPRIAQLKAEGMDVIVTDHHEIPQEGIPQSAVAVLNPTRKECDYPDTAIAGCMVAWLLMTAVRKALIEKELIPSTTPNLSGLLDFVAVGTVADCVSMARSINNRAVVNYGLKLIQSMKRPCWQACLSMLEGPVTAEDLGFKIGPLLNSDGRLATALNSVSLLLATTEKEAQAWVTQLSEQNKARKEIQKKITDQAEKYALQQVKAKKASLSIFLEEGHAGVHGISASRIKDQFGRPTIIFCPMEREEKLLTGSARGIDEIHLRDALQWVMDKDNTIIYAFGGHKGAAGLKIYKEKFKEFSSLFEQAVLEQLGEKASSIGPVLYTDGELESEFLNLKFIKEMHQQLEPFGREFEMPVFEATARIMELKLMGQTKTHARLELCMEDGLLIEAVWFNIRQEERDDLPVQVGQWIKIAYSPKMNYFRDSLSLNAQIIYAMPVE